MSEITAQIVSRLMCNSKSNSDNLKAILRMIFGMFINKFPPLLVYLYISRQKCKFTHSCSDQFRPAILKEKILKCSRDRSNQGSLPGYNRLTVFPTDLQFAWDSSLRVWDSFSSCTQFRERHCGLVRTKTKMLISGFVIDSYSMIAISIITDHFQGVDYEFTDR